MSAPPLQSEQKGIGNAFVYTELIVHFSNEVAAFLNGKASAARDLEPGDWVDYEPGDYQVIALPLQPLPMAEGKRRFATLEVEIDGRRFTLSDFPRFFSSDPYDPTLFRNGPTWLPTRLFEEGFFGRTHQVSVYEGGTKIFGPAERFFASTTSGILYDSFSDGDGMLVAEMSHASFLNLTGHGLNPVPLITLWSDPVFGEPTAARQVDEQGVQPLTYMLLGRDFVGDRQLFNEGVFTGLRESKGPVRIEVDFPQKGSGLANMMWGGYTGAGGFRASATVR
jgi:hypothetical protein